MACRAVSASVGARVLSGGVSIALSLLLSGCPEAVTGPAKATQLLFTVQPTSTVAGLPITPAVQVTARDARGNPVAGFTGNVTVALGTNPAGGTLSGSTTVAAVEGIATFPALLVDKSDSRYTLTATATGLSGATSATFVITPGTPTQLAFAVQPSVTAAGASITPALQVAVRDAHGNVVPSFTGNVTVALETNPAGGTLSGATSVAVVAGVATFSTLSVDRVGSGYALSAAAPGLSSTTSATFAVTAAAATQLASAVQPSTTSAGAGLQPAVQVTVQDALGNAVPGFTGQVSVAITVGTGRGGATLFGIKTVTPVAGIATFSNLSIDKSGTVKNGTGYTLSAMAAGLTGATSDPFDITPGAATQLVFSIQPRAAAAGAHIAPPVEVTALDVAGNLVPTFTATVTVAIGTNPAGGTISGTTTIAAVAGVATFSTLSIDKAGAGYTLLATASGLSATTSAAFSIVPGAASQLAFTVPPVATIAGATIRPAVQVTARDALGNTATGFAGNMTVAIATNPAGGTLSGTTTVAAVAGVATFSTLSIDNAGSGYRLSATAAGFTGAASGPFDIIPATAIRLTFSEQPSTAAAGAAIAPAVQVAALDAAGNTVTGFTGNVTMAIGANPGAAVLSGTTTVAATNGIATFTTLSINKSGTGYTLAATAAGLTGETSAPFVIIPGSAIQLAFTVQPSPATAGTSITPQVEVTARDALGNKADGFAGSVSVAIGSNPAGGTLSGTTTVAAVGGVAAFPTLSIDRAGVGYAISATAAGLSGAASTPFDITAVQPNQLVFTVPPTASAAGATVSPAVQVTARDASGQTATGFTGIVTLTITAGTGTSGATLSGTTTATAVQGVAVFPSLSINRSGTGYRLSATASGVSGSTSAAFTITAGAAAQLVFTVLPRTTTAGAAIAPAVQVTARDAQGNTVPGFTGNVSVAIGTNRGGTLSGTTTVPAVAGVATFSTLSIDQAESGYTLVATADGLSAVTSAAFTITAGPPVRLSFTVQPSTTTAGTTIAPAVQLTALDAMNNLVPGFTGSVTVAIGTNPAGGTLSGTHTVAAVAGVATFSTLSIDKAGNGYTLAATAPGLAASTSASFAIAPGTATQLAFTLQPSTTTTGATIKPAVRVTAFDALGNAATGFAGNVTVALGVNPAGGTLSGTRTFAAIAGMATFPSLNIDNMGSGYTLTASAPGVTGATSAAFDIIPSRATQLVFTVQPTDTAHRATAGVVFTPALEVTARDASGQTAASFTGTVTLTIEPGRGTGGATLSGTTTMAAVAGVATFANLSIDKSGGLYKLSAASPGLPAASSAFFKVIAGAASQLAFTVQPSTATEGATITPQVEVTARDALGNTADGFAASVTLAIGHNPGGGTLSGTQTVAAVAGVAWFPTLSVDRAGSGYTLVATAAGPSGATSAPFDVTATRATQLIFTAQPTSTTAGATISPAVQVTARDASGGTATSFTGSVTLTITAGTGTGGATLSGTTTAAAVAGVATFSTLSIDRSGSGYKLSATATGLAGARSSSFTINTGPPIQLDFALQPDSTEAGATIAPAVQVIARDALRNPVEAFSGIVTLAIGTNPGGGTLSGTTTVTAVAGVATFNDLSIDRTGVGYDLQATASGLAPATSTAFAIIAGPANRLLFTVQPSTTAAAATVRPAARVTALDALGNRAMHFTGAVTVALTAGTGSAGATLSGTTTVSAVDGVAIFSTLNIDRVGSGYTLSAVATGLTGATSTAFDIN